MSNQKSAASSSRFTKDQALLGAAAVVGLAAVGFAAYRFTRSAPSTPAKPEDHEVLRKQGNKFFEEKRFADAVDAYTKAINLKPDNVHVHYSNRAVAFVKLGKFAEALQDAEKTISLSPQFARGYERKGQALMGLGKFQEAVDAFNQCRDLLPNKQGTQAFEAMVAEAQKALRPAQSTPVAEPAPTPAAEPAATPVPDPAAAEPATTAAKNPAPAPAAPITNSAFVFIKPHAVTEATKKLVSETLKAKGLTILQEGQLSGKEIDEKKLIDQHYYAIASKATILKPHELPVPESVFETQFGLSWKAALESGQVFNAMDACKELGITALELDSLWAKCKSNKKLVKLGGGFYCGLVEAEGKKPIYVFNGFFMSMRSKFTAPDTCIHYYVVEWDAATLPWKSFRGDLLGPTDPADAPATSLRGQIRDHWQALGLAAAPNTGDNGVHASASPFEALAERMNWLSVEMEKDPFGARLLAAGVPKDKIKEWSVDPQVALPEGGQRSLFDSLEDMDSTECVTRCVMLAA